ncbi:hypothetical protein Sya03_46680 [Spirilliplanes yamanashiensis]|uniref:Uncharacterized protein n=1 Tax=Spirilliplanes yamanashiensis TaxID=42233 RepID=A0A8J3YAX7_9ACTN|nr:hypothetical protein Sya03_46680 [Spirilliplanes yamanashiensis]
MAGLAGLAGIAATGVVVARAERKRRAYTPDEIRGRLHSRLTESAEPPADPPAGATPPQPS